MIDVKPITGKLMAVPNAVGMMFNIDECFCMSYKIDITQTSLGNVEHEK